MLRQVIIKTIIKICMVVNKMPKISIAMTTYNGEKYVEKQLLSLFNQTRRADEVIIRDDVSSDKTHKIVRNFIEKNKLENWHFEVNEENLGYKKNFHTAIAQTTGDIIFLCDQDDIWLPEKLKEIENIMMNNPKVLAVNSSLNLIDGEDNPIQIKEDNKKSNIGLIKYPVKQNDLVQIDVETICKYNISPGCTVAFKKPVKDIYLKKSKCEMVHDWEINFIAAALDGLYFYNKPLIGYRIHSSNTIGLSELLGSASSIKNLANYFVRLKRAKFIYSCMEVFYDYYTIVQEKDKKWLKNQICFTKLRKEAIEKKSLIKLLSINKKYGKHYAESVTFKGRLGDAFCVVAPKKKEV